MLEKLRSTFDKGLATVSAKSESLAENGRVRTNIFTNQKKMESDLSALAPRIYAAWKAGSRSLEEFEADFAQIQAIEQEIASLQERLEEIKREEEARIQAAQAASAAAAAAVPSFSRNEPIPGGFFCSSCGRALPPGSRFCDVCGTPVPNSTQE